MNVGLHVTIANAFSSTQQTQQKNQLGIKNLYTQKVEGDELKALQQQIQDNAHAFTFKVESIQSSIVEFPALQESSDAEFQKAYEEFQNFLDEIGYEGKKIADLTQDEAKELVSEDGFFGVEQTANRIANFVIKGANGDESLLRAGLDGIMQGFDEAEKLWGGKLPEISYKTIQRSQELIQEEMASLGYSVLDTTA